MSCGCGVDKSHRKLTAIPAGNAIGRVQLGKRYMKRVQSLFDALKVMLEPVRHQHGLAVCRFNQILQSVQLAVVDTHCIAVFIVNRTVCHLRELARKSRRVDRVHIAVVQIENKVILHGMVQLHLVLGERDRHLVYHALRHLQVIGGFHADGDVRHQPVDMFLGSGQRFVGKHDLLVALVRGKEATTVSADEATEPFSHIQQLVLRPQIHKPVAAGCAGQANDAFYCRAHLHQRLEAFCLM